MRIVVVDRESEFERSSLVHTYSPYASAERQRHRRRGGRDRLPSSGVMVSSKLSKSSGFGKLVFIVDGRSSSVRSVRVGRVSQ